MTQIIYHVDQDNYFVYPDFTEAQGDAIIEGFEDAGHQVRRLTQAEFEATQFYIDQQEAFQAEQSAQTIVTDYEALTAAIEATEDNGDDATALRQRRQQLRDFADDPVTNDRPVVDDLPRDPIRPGRGNRVEP